MSSLGRVITSHYAIYVDGAEVAMQVRTLKNNVKQPDELRYLHADALGNIDTITDSHGAVLQRIAYRPFGMRQVTASNDPDYQAWTDRGFTGHEHLDGLGSFHPCPLLIMFHLIVLDCTVNLRFTEDNQ